MRHLGYHTMIFGLMTCDEERIEISAWYYHASQNIKRL